MAELLKHPELAGELLDYIEKQIIEGHKWVVYNVDIPITSVWDLECFKREWDAYALESEYQQMFDWHMALPIKSLKYNLEQIEFSLRNKDMNRNSLEDFQDHVKNLKIPTEMAVKVEAMMAENLPKIEVTGQLPSRKGYMEATLYLKRSEQSDYYFLNKYDLAYIKAKPLEEGKQYLVISEGENGKPQFKKFDSPIQAMDNFKKREGNAELAIGKSIKDKLSAATKKDGKVDYVSKEFQTTFYSDPLKNTIYINEGKAFNLKQSANMLLGGSAYRNDLVSRTGNAYEAWNTYQFDKPRDRYGNLQIKQYSEGYGFNLNHELQGYKIKELDNPAKLEQIITEMKDGGRPIVTVTNQAGEEIPMMVKAMPRYGNLNFYHPNGQAEKREQFQKENRAEIAQGNIFSKKFDQNKSQGQGLGV